MVRFDESPEALALSLDFRSGCPESLSLFSA
jgi:hypothetical protein